VFHWPAWLRPFPASVAVIFRPKTAKVAPTEITDFDVYVKRREFIKKAGLFAATSALWGGTLVALSSRGRADAPKPPPMPKLKPWKIVARGRHSTTETKTPYADITTYNNFYELGLSKSDPAELAHFLRPRPWSVRFSGEVEKPAVIDIDTLIGWFGLEERVYRLRCVEAWSMVIPWLGFPLADLIRRLSPASHAKYVQFTTLHDPEQLPGQANDILPWPYVEGLRIDEAMNPLALLAVGLYGAPLPGQNGAPIRLIVPWKYGFKSIKSIVEIRFQRTRPETTWNRFAPREYGFYANVNPLVDHPRWSQATERRIGELSRRKTLMYNGYASQVAHLYGALDLHRNF
jgi:sulfoxide reductase catalytic subunit YedY